MALVELALSNHANIVGANGLRAPLYLEKYEGYAEEILKGFRFGPHDAFHRHFDQRHSAGDRRDGDGRDSSRGLPVIGIVSRKHCEQSVPAHSSGKKLIDVSDVIIDNQCPPGDCVHRNGRTRVAHRSDVHRHRRDDHQHAALRGGGTAAGTGREAGAAAEPSVRRQHRRRREPLDEFYEAYRRSLAHLYA